MKFFLLAVIAVFVMVYRIKKAKSYGPLVRLTPSVDFETDMGKINNFGRLAYKKAA